MEQARDGYRRFLEVQVEALQEQLYGLERDPEQVEYLKSILRVCQRLRHARETDEPEAVRLLRNAVEKVTLHLGRASARVSQDILDFYVDTFDLLEDVVRRWPAHLAFDRARYADRVRGLMDLEAPPAGARTDAAVAEAGLEAPTEGFREGEPVEVTLPEERIEAAPGPAGHPAQAEEEREVPTWTDAPAEGGLEVLAARDLVEAERDLFVSANLAEILSEPWSGPSAPARAATAAPAGGLAASYATFESLRGGATRPAAQPGEAQAALSRLRDVLDAFSMSLTDLDRASTHLLAHDPQTLGHETLASLAQRLELEKQKLTGVFDRTIESFRAGAV